MWGWMQVHEDGLLLGGQPADLLGNVGGPPPPPPRGTPNGRAQPPPPPPSQAAATFQARQQPQQPKKVPASVLQRGPRYDLRGWHGLPVLCLWTTLSLPGQTSPSLEKLRRWQTGELHVSRAPVILL